VTTIAYDILARDRAAAVIDKVGKSSADAAAKIEAANIRVEKATKALAAAEAKHGKESLQARDASNKLTQSQLALQRSMVTTDKSVRTSSGSLGRFKSAAVYGYGLAGTAVALFAKKAVETASDINESQTKNQRLFGASAAAVDKFSKTSATGLGISRAAALEATGVFGNLLIAMKTPAPVAAQMSTRLVKLAADMASFNNADPSEVLDALRSGLVGEAEPLRKFGVNLSDAALRQKALSMGIYSGVGVLNSSQKAQASYALILEQTSQAQGDFARTSGGLANQQRIAKARFSDLSGELGAKLLPAVNHTLGSLLKMADFFQENSRVIGPLLISLGTLAASVYAVNKASAGVAATKKAWGTVADAIGRTGQAAEGGRRGIAGITGLLGGPWVLAITAGVSVLGYWMKKQADSRARVDELKDALDQQTGALTGNARAVAFKNLQDSGAIKAAKDLGLSLQDVTDAALGNTGAMNRVQSGLIGAYVAAQNTRAGVTGAGDAIITMSNSADTLMGALGGSNKELKEARSKLADAAAAGVTATGATTGLGTASGTTAGKIKDERTEAEKLRTALDLLTGKQISADEAAIAYEAAIDGLTKSVKENGKSLNINSEKGRSNRQAFIDAAKAAASDTVALRDNGASLTVVSRRAADHRKELIQNAIKLGLTRVQAERLTDKYYKIPKSISTTVVAKTADAERRIRLFRDRTNAQLRAINDERVYIALKPPPGVSLRQLMGDGYGVRGGPKGDGFGVGLTTVAQPASKATMAGAISPIMTGYDQLAEKLGDKLSAALQKKLLGSGTLSGGWRRQWALVHGAFPSAQLFSAYRPGARTVSGNVSYHALGRAIDVTPSMRIFDWIRANYGARTKELIFSPAGNRQIHNGQPHYYSGAVRAQHFCVPLDVEILTRRGWITHDHLIDGDETLGFNAATERTEWIPIQGVVRYDSAEVFEARTRGWSVRATAGHRWVTHDTTTGRYGWARMDDPRQRTWQVAAPMNNGDGLPITLDEAELLGWLVTDGGQHEGQHHRGINFSVHVWQTKPDGVARLAEILGSRAAWNGKGYRLRNAYARDLMARAGLTHVKDAEQLLAAAFAMTGEQRQAMLAGVVAGDGTVGPTGSIKVFQDAGPLCDLISTLAYLCGNRVTLAKRSFTDGRKRNGVNMHIQLCRPRATTWRQGRTSLGEMPVWCPTTELGSWTARFDGQPVLTGNSHVHWAFGSGGIASRPSLIGVGERGPERVLSPVQTRSFEQMVRVLDRRGPAGATGNQPVVIQLVADGSAAGNALIQVLRPAIRAKGGDVQVVLGKTG
jgi:hypothetical protein